MGNLAPLGALSGAAGGMADAVAGIIEQRLRQTQVANQTQQVMNQAEEAKARLAETANQNTAMNQYRADQLQATIEGRIATEQDTKSRNEATAASQYQGMLKTLPTGTRFTDQGYKTALSKGAIPEQFGAYQPPTLGMSTPTGEQGPAPEGRPFLGIQSELDKVAAAAKPKTLSAMEADKISELDKGIAVIQDLRGSLAVGDTGGWAQAKANLVPNALAGLVPGAPEAKATQADIVRAQQVVGRIIHGGVMRAADQVQAQLYMPQLGDKPSVITSKLDAVEKLAQESRTSHVENLGKAGYDVSNFAAADIAPPEKDATAATTPAAAVPAAPGAAATGKRKVYDQRGNLLNPNEGSSDVSSPASAVPTTPTTSAPAGVLRTAPATETPHQLSPEGLRTLQEREGGFYDTPYSDSGTGLAIGYGMHTFNGQPVKPDLRITKEQADQEMTKQIQQTYAPIVDRALKVPVTQAQYDALISMAWNSPASTLAVIQKLNTGTALSPADFQRSATVKGQPNAGLSQRRSREAAPFLNP